MLIDSFVQTEYPLSETFLSNRLQFSAEKGVETDFLQSESTELKTKVATLKAKETEFAKQNYYLTTCLNEAQVI